MHTIEFDYAALTLDSSIFICHSLNLERGLLGQLTQFASSPVKFVISEVVFQEVRKHLLEITASSRSKIQSALKSAKGPFGVDDETVSTLEDTFFGMKTDDEVVDARLEYFMQTTGAVVISAAGINVDKLLNLYFEAGPPFEGSGKKKAEFPDAIALLSLEKWAEEQQLQLLAVSQDDGWINFAKASDRIDVLKNLADALTHFQPHNSATDIVDSLKQQIITNKRSEILDTLNEFIIDSTNEAEVDVEYSSSIHAELEHTEVHYISHEFLLDTEDRPIVDVILIEKNRLSLRLRVKIQYEIQANFVMSAWDSIDREYISISRLSAVVKNSSTCDVLLSLTGDFSQGIEQAVLGEFGIDLQLPCADVGHVEPNMHDD